MPGSFPAVCRQPERGKPFRVAAAWPRRDGMGGMIDAEWTAKRWTERKRKQS
jgi:hypothetical protein